jgi:hypothetical protein
MKILCLIPTLPHEVNNKALHSVLNQTVPVEYILLLTKKVNVDAYLAQRVSSVMNDGLAKFNVDVFDYIWRLDADSVVPPDFLEKHIALDVDVVGGEGYAQLIKVSFFKEKMLGRFNSFSDDTYTYYKAKACGSISERVTPVMFKQPGLNHNKIRGRIYAGEIDYMIGDDPISVVVRALSYFYCLFTFKKPFEFAKGERVKNLKLMFRRLHI